VPAAGVDPAALTDVRTITTSDAHSAPVVASSARKFFVYTPPPCPEYA
jgi:hypothetical protein